MMDEKDPISTRVIEEIEECDEDSVEMSYGAVGPSQRSQEQMHSRQWSKGSVEVPVIP